MARIQVCAVVSGWCLISQHSISKQAAVGPILEINAKSFFFVFWACRAGTIYFCGKVLPVLFKMCIKSESILRRFGCVLCCDKFATAVNSLF
jgi:hypothetical protein